MNPGDADEAQRAALRSCQGKKHYDTVEAAGAAAAFAKSRGSKDTLRIYPCTICDGFHLTKTPLENMVR